MQKITENFSD